MNLYNELVDILIKVLFTDSEGVITITEWQHQVVEFVSLPILLILVACFVGIVWKCIKIPFYFFER